MRILRWILFLPVSVMAGVVVAVILVGFLGPSELNYSSGSAPAIAALNMALSSAVFLLVARIIAPSGKSWVVIGLGCVLVALNILELMSAIPASRLPAALPQERIRISEAVGFISVATTFGISEVLLRLRARRDVA